MGLSAATHRQFFLRQNIFRAFKNNDQMFRIYFRIPEYIYRKIYIELETNLINNQKTKLSKLTFRESNKILITSHQDLTRTKKSASTCRSHKICTRVNREKCGLRHTLLIHYLSVCPSSPFWLCHNYFLFSKILPKKIF